MCDESFTGAHLLILKLTSKKLEEVEGMGIPLLLVCITQEGIFHSSLWNQKFYLIVRMLSCVVEMCYSKILIIARKKGQLDVHVVTCVY